MFYERLSGLCKESGTSVAEIAENVLHVSSGAPTNWRKGASPKASTIELAARHFRVSTDYLLGLTSDRNASSPDARVLSPEEISLIEGLRAAPEPVRHAVLRIAASALQEKVVAQAPAASAAAPQADAAAPGVPGSKLRPFPKRPAKKPGGAWKHVEGRAAAGPPITTVPEDDDRRILVPVKYTGEYYFIVQAEGDSMLGVVGDGDYCVFNKYTSADNGRVVLVQVDGATDQPDATIKRIYRRGNKIELRSENKKYLPMLYPAEEVVVMGELVAVLQNSAL